MWFGYQEDNACYCMSNNLRPNITKGSTEENWNSFIARWGIFKRGTALAATEICQQLFICCDEELGNDLIRQNNDILNSTEQVLMETIKSLAVTPVAVSVRRSDLENVRSFHARIKGKAATCAYSITCSSLTCTQVVDFTGVIIKDVLISRSSDEEIKIEVFGWHDLDQKSVNDSSSKPKRWLGMLLRKHQWLLPFRATRGPPNFRAIITIHLRKDFVKSVLSL